VRVRVIFKLKNKGSYLPFHHQHLLAQFIKGVLIEAGDSDFAQYERISFSGLKGQTKVSRNGLHYFSNLVTVVLASDDKAYLDHLLDHIFKFEEIQLGNLNIAPLYTELEHVPELKEEMKYICISPIVPKRASFNDPSSKQFIMPESDEFSDLLYESTLQRIEATGKYTSEQLASFSKFQFVPDVEYLNKLRSKEKKFARIYSLFDQDVKYEVRGYTLPFTLYAAKEVQEFLFNCGLGAYAYKGFGMLDIANSNPVDRTEKYVFSKSLETA
jgi:CRISPR-associated endoribonuclease Cas6